MKRFLAIFICLILLCAPLSGCSTKNKTTRVLRVCNCEDYIDEDLIAEFEEEFDCVVEYSTFGTLENLYNDIKITPDRYDLICPSDYMIEKMAREGMLKKIDSYLINAVDYNQYVSPFIAQTFESITWQNGSEQVSLADYAICYMWGTLGLTFNPEYVSSEDMNSWGALWLDKYHNQSTIKDSIRDSYFIGIARAQQDVLIGLKEQLDAGNISIEEYNDQLKIIFNDTSEETVNNVEKVLKELKDNIWGFEVDSGKNDIASGKITINFAWSGDAVYAMDEAEKQGVELYYTVPEEGSNVWFDGWCVPKNAKNVELAVEFMNFLSRPEIVVRNMSYIGYTSGVGGQEVFDNAIDWYGACTLEESELAYEDYMLLPKEEQDYYEVTNDQKVYEYIYIDTETIKEQDGNLYVNVLGVNEDGFLYNYDLEIYAIDLSYFFGEGDWVIYVDTLGRQFSAQYPTKDVIDRCVVMNCYNEEANIRVTQMWERVKGFTFSNTVLIIIGCLVIACIIIGVLVKYREKLNIKITIKPRPNKNRQKYKVEKIEKIN